MNLEKPPFAPKQFVRIKSSGTILNVARCEKRVVHGALRWVVDDLNGSRAFAADCELIKNMELVNAETGEAVIHLEPKTAATPKWPRYFRRYEEDYSWRWVQHRPDLPLLYKKFDGGMTNADVTIEELMNRNDIVETDAEGNALKQH